MSRQNNTGKRGRGRPQSSNRVRIVPIPHAEPDARKLGRAFLALALHQANQTSSAAAAAAAAEEDIDETS